MILCVLLLLPSLLISCCCCWWTYPPEYPVSGNTAAASGIHLHPHDSIDPSALSNCQFRTINALGLWRHGPFHPGKITRPQDTASPKPLIHADLHIFNCLPSRPHLTEAFLQKNYLGCPFQLVMLYVVASGSLVLPWHKHCTAVPGQHRQGDPLHVPGSM